MSNSATAWTADQASLSMEFSRQEYWSRYPLTSSGDLPNPGIKPWSPSLQANSLPTDPPGKTLLNARSNILREILGLPNKSQAHMICLQLGISKRNNVRDTYIGILQGKLERDVYQDL